MLAAVTHLFESPALILKVQTNCITVFLDSSFEEVRHRQVLLLVDEDMNQQPDVADSSPILSRENILIQMEDIKQKENIRMQGSIFSIIREYSFGYNLLDFLGWGRINED